MEFSKYEAAANDFIMLDRLSGGPLLTAERACALCDRRTGVGADGVIEMLPSEACDVRMRILNADGSEAEMCGNGARALYLFALDSGAVKGGNITIETAAGVRTAATTPDGRFSIGMGEPGLERGDVPVEGPAHEAASDIQIDVDGRTLSATCASMGNPHCVLFVDDVDACPVGTIGPLVENHPMFPRRTNVEFVQAVDETTVKARVWERGVGETMACGTGACAIAVASNIRGIARRHVTVRLPGGDLQIDWQEDGVVLTGPARRVFEGKTVE